MFGPDGKTKIANRQLQWQKNDFPINCIAIDNVHVAYTGENLRS